MTTKAEISEREAALQARVEALEAQLRQAEQGQSGWLVTTPVPNYEQRGIFGCVDFTAGSAFIPDTLEQEFFATLEGLIAEFRDLGYEVRHVDDSSTLKAFLEQRQAEAARRADLAREKLEQYYAPARHLAGII